MFSIVHNKCSANGGVIVFTTIIIIGSVNVKRHLLEAIAYDTQINLCIWLELVPSVYPL